MPSEAVLIEAGELLLKNPKGLTLEGLVLWIERGKPEYWYVATSKLAPTIFGMKQSFEVLILDVPYLHLLLGHTVTENSAGVRAVYRKTVRGTAAHARLMRRTKVKPRG